VRKAVTDILEVLRPSAESPMPKGRKRRNTNLVEELSEMPHEDLQRLVHTLEAEMGEAAADLRFEYAARLRDEIRELKKELRELSEHR